MKNLARNTGLILLTGASGYIGRSLLPRLQRDGRQVRCLARHPEAVRTEADSNVEVFKGDVLDRESLTCAMDGIDTAYYLIHSMGSRGDFEAKDRQAARNFAGAARDAGVRRIIYLGGLASEESDLSAHLRSRHEVGRILLDSGSQVIEFRASVILGSGIRIAFFKTGNSP